MVYIKEMAKEIVDVLYSYDNGLCPYCDTYQNLEHDYEDGVYVCDNDHRIHKFSYESQYVDAIDEIKRFYRKKRTKK